MKKYYKNIEQALKELRPMDCVSKILSNKYAIIQPRQTDSSLGDVSVCGLDNNEIIFYCKWNGQSKVAFEYAESLPNIKQEMIAYYTNPRLQLGCEWRLKTIDNRRYKRNYRKIKQLLKQNNYTHSI